MRDGPAAQAPHQALVLHHECLPGWPVAGPLRQKRTTAVERSQLGQHPVTSQNDPLLLLLLLLFFWYKFLPKEHRWREKNQGWVQIGRKKSTKCQFVHPVKELTILLHDLRGLGGTPHTHRHTRSMAICICELLCQGALLRHLAHCQAFLLFLSWAVSLDLFLSVFFFSSHKYCLPLFLLCPHVFLFQPNKK